MRPAPVCARVENLRSVPVACAADLARLLAVGTRHRTVAATRMNETSSRAHTVIAITLAQARVVVVAGRIGVVVSQGPGGGSRKAQGARSPSLSADGRRATVSVHPPWRSLARSRQARVVQAGKTVTESRRSARVNLIDLAGSEARPSSFVTRWGRSRRKDVADRSLARLGPRLSVA